ncbi:hypothetical protein DNTS_035583 [Danionella cerebrum]|uniref:Uncharacterized protein n=1 Tax=Danionella cerebrum TaxID=2873325 RepID=A0A553NKX5_9TELE|nr:hypothetical protein DNTS_035583 [Danionella translucida]
MSSLFLISVFQTVLRRRSGREPFKDKKALSQDDSADLRCQLQFSKEESTLMRKKMAKIGREKDELEQELQKYKSAYGDVESPLPLMEVTGGGPHTTREAELRLRLKLVEEEANILGRKIVELEVENRGLRAENEDLRCQYERDCFGREPFSSVPTSPYGGDALEPASELRRHLQFVEEEAELLRRSISEIEDHNKQLTTELNRFKFGPERESEGAEGGAFKTGNGAILQEELKSARLQVNELSGKVMKLQYENRVLISNMQRCDLAAHLGMRSGSPRDSDVESDAGRREADDDETARLLLLHPKREGPVGGESDSEDLFEKTGTSGFASGDKHLDVQRRRDDLINIRREAERIGRTVERLITDTDSLVREGRLIVLGGDFPAEDSDIMGDGDSSSQTKPESQVLDSINARMRTFRIELQQFMDKVDHLGESLRDRGDDLSPMPHLTESSSFLSTMTSMSRDSPIGTLGRDLVTDFQMFQPMILFLLVLLLFSSLSYTIIFKLFYPSFSVLNLCLVSFVCVSFNIPPLPTLYPASSSNVPSRPVRASQERSVVRQSGSGSVSGRGAAGFTRFSRAQSFRAEFREPALPEMGTHSREAHARDAPPRLEHERRTKTPAEEREPCTQEDERRHTDPRRGLELQGLQPHEPTWPQERALLQQEVRSFRHNMVMVYMKLRWVLMHWRRGRRTESAEEEEEEGTRTDFDRLENLPELSFMIEQGEGDSEREDKLFPQITGSDITEAGPLLLSPDRFQYQKQAGESRQVLHALLSLLEELTVELREEAHRRWQLQQSLASERASVEIQQAQMRSHVCQLQEVRGDASGEASDVLQCEREEQRHRLAESHSATMELRWKLQQGEKRWSRERSQLIERFHRERQDWERSLQDMQSQMEQILKHTSEGGARFLSPQESPCNAPRPPRLHCSRSHSDSEATLEEKGLMGRHRLNEGQPRPPESLFLDALSLDPLSKAAVPPPSRLESEKRFPHMKEALNETPDTMGPVVYLEEEKSGSLLRAKSVCSMSDFQRLMDSSPFLPDQSRSGEHRRDDVTPPLSPDDFKYIEEFTCKGWDLSASSLPTCPIPGPVIRSPIMDAWGERAEPTSEAFQPTSWFLTTSATLTTNTMSNPEYCQKVPLRAPQGSEQFGVHVLHSPSRGERSSPGSSDQEYTSPKVTKSNAGEVGESAEEVFVGRWPCHSELGRLPGEHPTICAAAGYSSSLELEMSPNLSDDMKEKAFSARNAIRSSSASGSSPPERQLRDMACQTNGLASRGTQTTQTISVGLQTETLRAITSSPHRCLTPKGGSTPISSPSRSLRKIQYSPVVQAKFERPCCSPKYGSPKLQRKPSNASKTEQAVSQIRTPPPTSTAQQPKGNSESAWARSTTTRDSPVHTTINDGLSSLFNIIDHTPIALEPIQKFNKSPSRSRPAESMPADPKSPAQGQLRNSRGRSPSPVQLIVETQGDKTPEVISIKQDLSAPPGYTLAENAARILNKKLLEQSFREERRLSASSLAVPGRTGDAEKPGCLEDLPRSPVAPPLDSCFLRPARPANRRPPSRWANHSPSSSPNYRECAVHFRFPSPIRAIQSIPEGEESGLEGLTLP